MPTATRLVDERVTSALGIRPSACKANRPVSGWGQGRQPPEAVARSASLEASRSRVYLKQYICSSATGFLATVAPEKRLLLKELDASIGASGPHDFAVHE